MKKLLPLLFLLFSTLSFAQSSQPTQQGAFVSLLNNAVTGTVANTLTSLDTSNPSRAVVANAGSTSNIIGITAGGAGKANAALVQILGQVNCQFDNSSTAGDYVQPSSITMGYCHDTGVNASSTPPAGLNVALSISTNSGAGMYTVLLLPNALTTSNGISTPVSFVNGGTADTYGPAQTFIQLTNSSTVQGSLVKLTGPGQGTTPLTTDTDGMLGICNVGCGTSGTATIQVAGIDACNFDGATTQNDWVKISSTTAGDCSDAGSTRPSSSQNIGRVLSTNSGAGSYQVALQLDGAGGSSNNSVGAAGVLQASNGSSAFQAYGGSSCPANQVPISVSSSGILACVTITSGYVNNSIALTGGDINTSNQVVSTHLTSPLPTAQGGSGLNGTTATPHCFLASEGNGPFNPIALAVDQIFVGAGASADPVPTALPDTSGTNQALSFSTSTNLFSVKNISTNAYATVVNTTGTSITATCSATSGSNPSRDMVWQVLSGATTYTTPTSGSNCLNGDQIEAYFIQADNHSYQLTVADGAGTNHVGALYATPTSTAAGQGYFIHVIYEYHTSINQWELIGQSTNPATPLPLTNGGTQCGGPVLFANLPGSPTIGNRCTITDANACEPGYTVTVGGGLNECVLEWNGANWLPAGGAHACSGSVTLSGGTGTISLSTGCSTASSLPFCADTTAANTFTATPGTNSIAITAGHGSDVIQCAIVA